MPPRKLMSLMVAISLCGAGVIASADDDNPGEGASVGDSCQTNRDCDKDKGQHCVKNACAIPKKAGNSKPPDTSPDQPPPPACPGVPAGYTLKCKLNSGQVVDACGMPGAIPAPIGAQCHIGYELGNAIQ